MPDTALTVAQIREVDARIENGVRRYFDHYLENVFPRQQRALREHTHTQIALHDRGIGAHGGVERKVSRLLWVAVGAAATGGGVGAGLARLLAGS